MEADGQMSAKRHISIIETNQQFGAGRVEPEKEKNPKQESEDLLEQSHENESHQVEPEKEKNPEPETAEQQDGVIRKGEKTISFRNRPFKISFEPENKKTYPKLESITSLKLEEKLKNIQIEIYNFTLYIKLDLKNMMLTGKRIPKKHIFTVPIGE